MPKYYFDEEYFERGADTGKSMYQNYRWIPTRSFAEASVLQGMYPGKSILDFGCAKGYLVHALNILGVNAYGYDVSEYALKNCKEEVRKRLFSNLNEVPKVDVIFIKDVLEHIQKTQILSELSEIRDRCKEVLVIIPLGDDGVFRIDDYAKDPSHLIAEDEEWWCNTFLYASFRIVRFQYHIDGFKDHWFKVHPYGNAVFRLEVL